MPWYENYYQHCDTNWSDQWDCMCNDECPECKLEIEPHASEEKCVECGSYNIVDDKCIDCGDNWENQCS